MPELGCSPTLPTRCLAEGLSAAMVATKKRRRGHDRGQVLVHVAVMIAGDGESISDQATLRDQPELFGEVASTPRRGERWSPSTRRPRSASP